MNDNMELSDEEVDRVYDNNYFKLNKKLQIVAGLWPYKSRRYKLFMQIIIYLLLFIVNIPFVNALGKWCGKNLDICGENTVAVIYTMIVFLKHWVTVRCERRLKNVYRLVAKNWVSITDPKEHKILVEYAKQGRAKTIGYMIYLLMAGIGFCEIPMVPIMLDYIIPLNESRPKILFIKGEYIIDPYEHFYKLYAFFAITSISTVTVLIAIDTMYSTCVHQILAIFAIIKQRLHLATMAFNSTRDVSYDMVVQAIVLHQATLQFVRAIEDSYSLLFLLLTGITILFLSIGSVVVMVQSDTSDIFRLGLAVFGSLVHFGYISYPGQQIIDHSNDLYLATYTNEWYNVSKRTKILLQFVMLRCIEPCIITAGGLYVMNLENFGSIVKTAVSYMAIIASFR